MHSKRFTILAVVFGCFLTKYECLKVDEKFKKLIDARWQCDTICKGSGGDVDYHPETNVCKCTLNKNIDDVDIELMLKNACKLGLNLQTVAAPDGMKKLAKRDIESDDLDNSPKPARVGPQGKIPPGPSDPQDGGNRTTVPHGPIPTTASSPMLETTTNADQQIQNESNNGEQTFPDNTEKTVKRGIVSAVSAELQKLLNPQSIVGDSMRPAQVGPKGKIPPGPSDTKYGVNHTTIPHGPKPTIASSPMLETSTKQIQTESSELQQNADTTEKIVKRETFLYNTQPKQGGLTKHHPHVHRRSATSKPTPRPKTNADQQKRLQQIQNRLSELRQNREQRRKKLVTPTVHPRSSFNTKEQPNTLIDQLRVKQQQRQLKKGASSATPPHVGAAQPNFAAQNNPASPEPGKIPVAIRNEDVNIYGRKHVTPVAVKHNVATKKPHLEIITQDPKLIDGDNK